MFKKIMIHIFGLILLAFGITGVLMARLGASPLDAFNQFASDLIPLGYVTVAVTTFISNFIMALVIFILTRKKELGLSIVVSFILSLFIQGWIMLILLVPESTFNSLFFRIPLALTALLSAGFGTAVLIVNAWALSPYDEVMMYIAGKTNSIKKAKIIVDATFFVGAVILGIISKNLFEHVFIFSIIVVMGLGPLINYFVDILKRRIDRNETEQVY